MHKHRQPLPLGQRFHGQVPIELTGSTVFPAIGLRPYLLTLPGYGSYWFRIVPSRRRPRQVTVPEDRGSRAAVTASRP